MSSPATDPAADRAEVRDDDGPAPLVRRLAAEALGTFVFVLVGCGAIVHYSTDGEGDAVAIALAFGLAWIAMAAAFGRVSGAHFNPAVSVAAGVAGRMAWREVAAYAGAQVLGAILGAGLLLALMQGYEPYSVEEYGLGQNGYGDDLYGYAGWAAFLLEMLLTFLLVTVVLAVTDRRQHRPGTPPFAIGLAYAALYFLALPATGASLNPARSIGPGLFAGVDPFLQLWLFLLAPVLGALLGGAAYPALFGRDADPVAGSGLRMPERASREDQGQQGYGAWQGQQGQQAWTGEPIIQDGWQWDPAAQQWIPAQQQYRPPTQDQGQAQAQVQAQVQAQAQAQPAARTEQLDAHQGYAAPQPQAGQDTDPYGQPGQWPDDGPTQVRPGR